ncbi:putative pentatricopeptide repeat-containing protein [Hordeum vulgare]|nr:putative pentatricopeptide repeat-containing protein [Hordeum vulgare]
MFSHALVEEFVPEEFKSIMHNLLQLRQTCSMIDYRQQSEVYTYNLLALDDTLSSKFFVTQCLLDLKDELRVVVRIQAPNSITRATIFARTKEEELENQCPKLRPMPIGRPPPALPFTMRSPPATLIGPKAPPP